MADKLSDFYHQFCLKYIDAGLNNAVGHPPNIAQDEALYKQVVIDPAWESLPLPLRMMTRERLHWDELFAALRKCVFRLDGGKIAFRTEAAQNINSTINTLFADARPAPAPIAMPASKPTPTAGPAPKGAPEPEVNAIGIDLGTTYSVVAHVDSHGRPYTINNGAGDLTTPSVILLDEGGPVVGKEAVMAAPMEPERIAVCVKRDMGARVYRRKVKNENFPPEVLSSIILRTLKEDAERRLGTVQKAVITVPAYFDEARRRATMDAGRMAGLDVLSIINEPTSAAIAYGYQSGFLNKKAATVDGKPVRALIYDLGGGTFDVTIMQIEGNSFTALATDGDVALGGRDFDEKLVEMAAERIKAELREDPRGNPNTLEELWQAAETAKKTLTERPKATMYINHVGSRHKVEITREEFEEATASLLGRTRTTCEIVVRQAGLKWSDIDQVLMVGGSTRMPMIREMLEETCGKTPDQSVSPDEAVAHGAALYAQLLLKQQGLGGRQTDFSVTNVNSHSLGLVGIDKATGRRKNQILIPKNTALPHSFTGTFKTHRANQANVVLRIVEGESERPEACTPIGTCKVDLTPPTLPAGWPIMVKYSYLADGQLRVSAQVKGQSKAISTVFQRENNMADNEISLWNYYLDSDGKS